MSGLVLVQELKGESTAEEATKGVVHEARAHNLRPHNLRLKAHNQEAAKGMVQETMDGLATWLIT